MKRNSRILKNILFIPVVFLLFLNTLYSQDGTIFPDTYGEELILDLQSAYKPATVQSYDNARDIMFGEIDNHNDNVTCVYTGLTIYIDPTADPSSDAYNKDMNTEHTWPQSMGADVGNAHSDMHHLYPVRIEANSSRGNSAFADINDASTDTWWRLDYSQSYIPTQYINEYSEKDNDADRFEPREDHKGNAARSMFYFYTMYRDQADADFFESQKETLRSWNLQDAPDSREEQRNSDVAAYQSGKENPFILDTTLVRRAFFADGPPPAAVDNPQSFTAATVDSAQINLAWTKNSDNDDVMIVWNTTGSFQSPQDSTTYSQGESALGGSIIARSSATAYLHSGLTASTTYYYRAFSVHGAAGSEEYSSGLNANATTESGSAGNGEAQPGDIVITEIMQNPGAVYDSEGEWFEIYNASEHTIDLNGWFIKDNDTDSHQIANGSALLVESGGYLVLGRNANSAENGGVQEDYQYSGVDLANGADEIVLFLADGVMEIDRVEYDGGPQWPDPSGASMYFNGNMGDNNNDHSLWAVSDLPWAGSAGDKGTPGFGQTPSLVYIDETTMPKSFSLKNYPNPFNPLTEINWQLAAGGNVELTVYNLLGEKIRTLVQERQAPGTHSISFDAGGLSSGVYLYKLQVGNTFQVRKMVLAR